MLSVRHLTKSFGPVVALDDVTLDVTLNEVLGVVGDNGAGKSTFLSLLTGYLQPDSGELWYRGRKVVVSSPSLSRRELSMEMIYQDPAVAPDLTVWQNLFLGQEARKARFFLDSASMRRRTTEVLESMDTKIRATDLVSALSGGERQLVAVARALLFDREVILMDEPTAAVSAAKAEYVLRLVESLRSDGKTVLLISHRLEDVLRVCDRVAVFVTGRLAHLLPTGGLDVSGLAHLMFASGKTRAA